MKGLTQFSDVLSQMATNLSWTSALGDAYYNIPQSVMNAVQVMRQRAYQAGNLKSTQQQNVTVQNQAPGSGAASDRPQRRNSRRRSCSLRRRPSSFSRRSRKLCTCPPIIRRSSTERLCRSIPGYSTGAMVATSLLSFGVGIAVGAAISGGWMLRMGIQLVGMRLEQLHRGLQPQHLHFQLQYVRQSQQLLQPQRE